MTQIFSAISQLQYFSKLRATSREGGSDQAGRASRAGQGRAGRPHSHTWEGPMPAWEGRWGNQEISINRSLFMSRKRIEVFCSAAVHIKECKCEY